MERAERTGDQLVTGILPPQSLPKSLRDALTAELAAQGYWRKSGERSTFFVQNPEAKAKIISEPLEETGEIVRYRDAVKAITSNRSSASADDHVRPVSYASVTSQDASSLLRRMVTKHFVSLVLLQQTSLNFVQRYHMKFHMHAVY